MLAVMRSFFQRYQFNHPTTEDFRAVAEEVSGQDLSWFFEGLVYNDDVLNYTVTGVDEHSVTVARQGNLVIPTEVLITFCDGSTVLEPWDGLETEVTFTYPDRPPIRSAEVDPQHKLVIDLHWADNGLSNRAEVSSWLALVTRLFQVHIRDAERKRRRAIGLLNVHLQETLSGVEVVRAFGRAQRFVARFRSALRETVRTYRHALSYNVFYTPSLTVLVALGVALLLWMGTGGLGQNWGLSMGTLTAFILLFQRFFEPIRNLGEDWQTVQSALSGIERIVQVLDVPLDDRPTTAAVSAVPDGGKVLVAMRDVMFGYLPEHPVLQGLTFSVHAGEHVAIVGRTGAGKSSAVRLLAGLYAPWSGDVCVAIVHAVPCSWKRLRMIVALWPPNPNELDITCLTSLDLFVLGT